MLDGGSVRPVFVQDRIDPDGAGKGLSNKLQPFIARFPGPFLHIDGAIGGHQFVGRHAGIPHDDEPCLRIQSDHLVNLLGFGTPLGILPEIIVDRVVKEEGLEILELGAGIIEEGLHQIDIRIHGPPAVINGQDHL